MTIETKTVYKCDYCGANFQTVGECKEHEQAHFDINLVPLEDQHFIIGKQEPNEVILTGYALENRKAVIKRFVYILKGELKNG